MKVLVIDDDVDVVKALTKALERASYSVTSVDNGIAAFAELGQKEFDAVICDFRLPFLDGRNFFEQVEDLYPTVMRRLIWVTGFTGDPDTREFLESTGRPFLGKPYELTELMTLVRDVAAENR